MKGVEHPAAFYFRLREQYPGEWLLLLNGDLLAHGDESSVRAHPAAAQGVLGALYRPDRSARGTR